jgi:molecular chaperone GrpE
LGGDFILKIMKSQKTKPKNLSEKEIIESLIAELGEAREKEQRALADYQNLVRRTQEERSRVARLAARNFIEDILQPIEHLSMAVDQVNDSGLNMIKDQLWKALERNGLKEFNPLGEKFDVETMEAVEKNDDGDTVVKVVNRGYFLNGEIVQHAKVVTGKNSR